ncbi:MAG: hypothetical protein U0263_31400 [Polyangiaceae bacterium]
MSLFFDHITPMNRFNVPHGGDDAEAARIRAAVDLETLVLREYPLLEKQIKIVSPSRFLDAWEDYNLIPERVLWLLPSPFRPPGDRSRSVLVLPKNGLWRDRKFHREGFSPDVIGFVMAYDSCSYAEALAKLHRVGAQEEESERRCATAEVQLEVLSKILAALKN